MELASGTANGTGTMVNTARAPAHIVIISAPEQQ
jgi:hypothetical protein